MFYVRTVLCVDFFFKLNVLWFCLKTSGAYRTYPTYVCTCQWAREHPFKGQGEIPESVQKGELSQLSSGYDLGSLPFPFLTTMVRSSRQIFWVGIQEKK